MTLLQSLYRCLGSHGCRDELLWHVDLKPHAYGDFSIAVVQANARLEDQGQVLASPSVTYVGVYDGHGGPEAARFLNEHLFAFLRKFVEEHGGLSAEVIKKAFNKTEEEFLRLVRGQFPTKPQIASVGSCCLLGAISENVLYVANLGDSRSVIGRRLSGFKKDVVVAERLTTDHNVASVEVREEVQELHPDDSDVVVHARGAWRIKGIIQSEVVLERQLELCCSVQVSRSIGDFYLKKPEYYRDPKPQNLGNPAPLKRPFITAEPSVLVRKLTPDDLFLIFASDGLWEHLSDEAAVDIVTRNPRAGIARRLIRAAIEESAKKREVQYDDIKTIEKGVRRFFHDDITVIVVFLDHRRGHSSGGLKRHALGCTAAPMDIYSLNAAGKSGVHKNISWTKTSNIELNHQLLRGHGQQNW